MQPFFFWGSKGKGKGKDVLPGHQGPTRGLLCVFTKCLNAGTDDDDVETDNTSFCQKLSPFTVAAMMSEREEEITNINKDMKEVEEINRNINTLIKAQEESLELISTHVKGAQEATREGLKQIQRAGRAIEGRVEKRERARPTTGQTPPRVVALAAYQPTPHGINQASFLAHLERIDCSTDCALENSTTGTLAVRGGCRPTCLSLSGHSFWGTRPTSNASIHSNENTLEHSNAAMANLDAFPSCDSTSWPLATHVLPPPS